MEKKEIKKLALTKETLRSLVGRPLEEVIGGTGPAGPTQWSFCGSCYTCGRSSCCAID